MEGAHTRTQHTHTHEKKVKNDCQRKKGEAVVVAQLAERSLRTPEIRGLNPDIGNILNILSVNCYPEKTKVKKKRPGMAHFFKKKEGGGETTTSFLSIETKTVSNSGTHISFLSTSGSFSHFLETIDGFLIL